MSSEAPEQPTAEDVSFADILDQPEGSNPSPAEKVKEAAVTEAPSTNGDAAPETDGTVEPAEPMEVSEGVTGAAGDAGATSDEVAAAEETKVAEEVPVDAEAAPMDDEAPVTDNAPAAAEAPAADETVGAEEAPTAKTEENSAPEKLKMPSGETAPAESPGEAASSKSKESPEPEHSAKESSASDSATKEDAQIESVSEKAKTELKPTTKSPGQVAKPASKQTADTKPKTASKITTAASKTDAKPTKTAAASDNKSSARKLPPGAEPIREFSNKAKTPEPELTELEKLWKPVKQNPADFTAWTLLIQYAENQCFMEDIRSVLKAFLARYPYCYGYWKKYSDLEKKRGTIELCNEVFEAGLAAVPLSVDLWLHYLHHLRSVYEDKPEVVRAGFERAVAACGTEFRSDRLWEQYASWEAANKEPVKALAVYKRAIAVPTLSYRTHFENLEQFVGETPPQELLTVEEFLEARRAVLAELRASEPAAAPPAASTDLLPPGCDEPPPGVPAQPAGLSSDEECVKLRAKILAPLRQLHKDTEKQVSLRWNFEEGIKRPYFHVKPLEKVQLKNWKAYLEFEIEQGDKHRIHVLFERCMISCALYEEYWLKYVRYLESLEPCDWDAVRSVYRRACWTHLPDKPAIHLMWATFEEKQGDLDAAAEVMRRISAQVSMLEVTLRSINLARRAGKLDAAERMYAEALKSTEHRETAVVIAVKFARFLNKIRGNREKALEVLKEAIRLDQTNMRLYMQLVDVAFQSRPVDVALVKETFQTALEAPFEQKDKLTLTHRRMEFLEEFDTDAESIQKAHEEYYGLLKVVKAEAKKKKQEEEAAAAASKAKTPSGKRSASTSSNGTDKKARTDSTSGAGSGTHIPTITETPARATKAAPTPYRGAAPGAPGPQFSQPPPVPPQAAYQGYNQMPPQQQQPYQYPPGGYQQQGAPGWTGYPPQYNYNQYGQGYQYPYQ
ncbi:pre-mRNA-processing factor 39-like isoform X4 [Amphibalanus amphitrite]|uniref:pre-mRNA-processing factor 39-like isoform X4 n=1 Tax=Amphibalanus amphitrite TaxID=1232801 RepID=UPI001C9024DC|nr:pre-mRNA-processing factor 39-like isoform X4 [Amphibalanus amphitrite]XP_043227157.1 pre-mRNA-processing factor 39-like isoform X4 [Amphibalanus amphitrite]XP_043227158.1 pre-mRNA-processing factor 39-like isoform X4 [Amphibalanus amphitrite]